MTVAPRPGRHGGDGARLAAALGIEPAAVLDLSASMNPVAPDPTPVVARHLDGLGRYPDPAEATAALAEAMGVDPACLLLTNGGAEAIALVAAEIGGHVVGPEFGLYERHLDSVSSYPDPARAEAALAERLGAPVLSSYGGRGLLPPAHPCLVPLPPHDPAAGALWVAADGSG